MTNLILVNVAGDAVALLRRRLRTADRARCAALHKERHEEYNTRSKAEQTGLTGAARESVGGLELASDARNAGVRGGSTEARVAAKKTWTDSVQGQVERATNGIERAAGRYSTHQAHAERIVLGVGPDVPAGHAAKPNQMSEHKVTETTAADDAYRSRLPSRWWRNTECPRTR